MSVGTPWSGVVYTLDLSASLDDASCVCGHLIRRHSDVPTVGCPVPRVATPWESCPCALAEHEAKFAVELDRGGLAGGSVQVARVDRLGRYVRGVDHVPHPAQLRWFVRPHYRSLLFILFTTHAEALDFATRDWRASGTYLVSELDCTDH